jgi:hypothetical protein
MRLSQLVCAFALLTLSASAQDKKDAAPQDSIRVLVNGQPMNGKVLEIDGKHFVAIEDLAQSLRGNIDYGDGQIALTLPQIAAMTTQGASARLPAVTPPPASPQLRSTASERPTESGRVQGILTYFFSFQVGAKPDAGSKVWLVKGHAEIPADLNFVATSSTLGTSRNPQLYDAFKYSIADENGNFELLNIPPGEYTLILQSAHTKGTLNEKTHIFGKGNSRNPRDSSGRVESRNLQIKPGEAADGSKDFGPNIDR